MIEAFRRTKEWHNNTISGALTNWIDPECILFIAPWYLGSPRLSPSHKYFMPRVVPTSVENRRTTNDPSLYGPFGGHPRKFLRRKPWKTDNLPSISIRIALSPFWRRKKKDILYKPLNLKGEIIFRIDLYIRVFHGRHRIYLKTPLLFVTKRYVVTNIDFGNGGNRFCAILPIV